MVSVSATHLESRVSSVQHRVDRDTGEAVDISEIKWPSRRRRGRYSNEFNRERSGSVYLNRFSPIDK